MAHACIEVLFSCTPCQLLIPLQSIQPLYRYQEANGIKPQPKLIKKIGKLKVAIAALAEESSSSDDDGSASASDDGNAAAETETGTAAAAAAAGVVIDAAAADGHGGVDNTADMHADCDGGSDGKGQDYSMLGAVWDVEDGVWRCPHCEFEALPEKGKEAIKCSSCTWSSVPSIEAPQPAARHSSPSSEDERSPPPTTAAAAAAAAMEGGEVATAAQHQEQEHQSNPVGSAPAAEPTSVAPAAGSRQEAMLVPSTTSGSALSTRKPSELSAEEKAEFNQVVTDAQGLYVLLLFFLLSFFFSHTACCAYVRCTPRLQLVERACLPACLPAYLPACMSVRVCTCRVCTCWDLPSTKPKSIRASVNSRLNSATPYAHASLIKRISTVLNVKPPSPVHACNRYRSGVKTGDTAKLSEALEMYRISQYIVVTESVVKKIAKVENALANLKPLGDGYVHSLQSDCVVLDGKFMLSFATYSSLYPHQREGLQWLWGLHTHKETELRGGILGDDMGLGKTLQTVAFLDGLLGSEQAATAMIVMPVSLLANWAREFEKWAPGIRVETFHGSSKKQRKEALGRVRRHGGVLLTTYGLVVSSTEELNGAGTSSQLPWDYVILDEGHKIKNHTRAVSKKCREVQTKHRLLLSGTPIQNNLNELWALFDFVCFGELLDTLKVFNEEFANGIENSTLRNASENVRGRGERLAIELRELIKPHFLRRDKTILTKLANKEDDANAEHEAAPATAVSDGSKVDGWAAGSTNSGSVDGGASIGAETKGASSSAMHPKPPTLSKKTELVCWIPLATAQVDIYNEFLQSDRVKEQLNSTRSPLAALTVLKKICDHPALLPQTTTGIDTAAAAAALAASGTSNPSTPTRPAGAAGHERFASPPQNGLLARPMITPARSLAPARPMITPARSLAPSRLHAGANGGGAAAGASRYSDLLGSNSGIPTFDHAARQTYAGSSVGDGVGGGAMPMLGAAALQPTPSGPDAGVVAASGKLMFLVALLERLKATGHRVLIFSQSKKMLDIIGAQATAIGEFLRIDGDVKDPNDRQKLIDKFNGDTKYFAFLLTTQVGGVGLTLTGADRVVIFDPSWNPSTDAQAVDRAYRIGQDKNVIVYRLVTCGTVEEKIYRKQVYKNGLQRAITKKKAALGYFTKQELKALFNLDNGGQASETQKQLSQEHASQCRFDEDDGEHISFLETLPLYGLSNHALLFNRGDAEADEDADVGAAPKFTPAAAKHDDQEKEEEDADAEDAAEEDGGNGITIEAGSVGESTPASTATSPKRRAVDSTGFSSPDSADVVAKALAELEIGTCSGSNGYDEQHESDDGSVQVAEPEIESASAMEESPISVPATPIQISSIGINDVAAIHATPDEAGSGSAAVDALSSNCNDADGGGGDDEDDDFTPAVRAAIHSTSPTLSPMAEMSTTIYGGSSPDDGRCDADGAVATEVHEHDAASAAADDGCDHDLDHDHNYSDGVGDAGDGTGGDDGCDDHGFGGNHACSHALSEDEDADGMDEPIGDMNTSVCTPPPMAGAEAFVVDDAVFESPVAFVLSPRVGPLKKAAFSTPLGAAGSPLAAFGLVASSPMARSAAGTPKPMTPAVGTPLGKSVLLAGAGLGTAAVGEARTVCVRHASASCGIAITRCSCFLDSTTATEYAALASAARAAYAVKHDDLRSALEATLAALDLCDEDTDLHAMAYSLGTALGFAQCPNA